MSAALAVTASNHAVDEVRELISREPWVEHDRPTISGWLQRVCRAAARELAAAGVGISLVSEQGDFLVAAASDPPTVALEELQLTLGQGPSRAAYEAGEPVLVSDLTAAEQVAPWQGYASVAVDHGVGAVFAFPLRLGAARVGSLNVYRARAGGLSETETLRASAFTEVAMRSLLDASEHAGGVSALFSPDGHTRLEVYQAQGMVMIQLGVGAPEALARMRAHAFASDRGLSEVAEDLIDRKLHLERDSP